ncbi:response regulator [Pseudomonas eucalypticola]|uniref:Sensory/regulatory protein RpfC n=1 Tax=Pseudomonas eucalypticola TaxID=2599595 RepID=A0A7D5HVS1_9PSED|nr:response regulator [Pseudomonas eucalypticola]QKZ03871.1 response regulator [Pseudomonas eucalypticola]
MKWRPGWDIHSRTQVICLGPALLLTLLLTGFFTFVRLHDLHEEMTRTGQLIANQLAPAAEFGVISNNTTVLDSLLRATLEIPHVRFLEVQDSSERVLLYVEQPDANQDHSAKVQVFQASIRLQRADQGHDNYLRVGQPDCVGRVIVGMSNDAFNQRQQEILLKAAVLALFALLFSFLLARRLALSLARPISQMGLAVKAIQEGDFKAPLPIVDDAELGSLAQHINNLATGLEKAGREQRQTIEQLVSTREQAERANSAKSDFLAMMSHELRTPMNGVLGMLQLLETTVMTEEQHEYAALATQSTEHLLKVINDILDFSRIERAALELEHIPFNLGELVASCAQAFQHNASARNLSLNLNLPPGIDHLQVEGDPTRIRQILVNLIGNAIKFTEVGSVQIDAHWQVLDHQLIWLTCTVRDTGIGISAERLESMFVAFQQADSSISRRYGGTGLGLPIARTLAERMGGTLQAESREGNGSLFTLEIPLAFSQRSVAPLREPRLGEEAHGVGKRVLLVEDNPVNQTVIEAMLRSLGCVVCVVGDGAQAIHEVGQQPFDAVLMDCRLPIVDGYEATRRIRQLPEHAQLPIIALTANALLGDREACLSAGMNDYLAKPFKRTDLKQILQRWLVA